MNTLKIIFDFNDRITLGTCSLCGGPVTMPKVTSTNPQLTVTYAAPAYDEAVPTCDHCGAHKREENYGPVIDMVPQK